MISRSDGSYHGLHACRLPYDTRKIAGYAKPTRLFHPKLGHDSLVAEALGLDARCLSIYMKINTKRRSELPKKKRKNKRNGLNPLLSQLRNFFQVRVEIPFN